MIVSPNALAFRAGVVEGSFLPYCQTECRRSESKSDESLIRRRLYRRLTLLSSSCS